MFERRPAISRGNAGPLRLVERMLVLMQARMLRAVGAQVIADLAAEGEEVILAPGEVVFAPGVGRDRILVIAEGQIASQFGAAVLLQGPGEIAFGSTLFTDGVQGDEAHATSSTRALAYAVDAWMDEMETHFEMVRAIVAALDEDIERLILLAPPTTEGIVLR